MNDGYVFIKRHIHTKYRVYLLDWTSKCPYQSGLVLIFPFIVISKFWLTLQELLSQDAHGIYGSKRVNTDLDYVSFT